MKKKLLSTLLVLCLVATLLPSAVLAAPTEQGTGTAKDPYVVTEPGQLTDTLALGGYVRLECGVKFSYDVSTGLNAGVPLAPADKTIVLDLNGNSIQLDYTGTDGGILAKIEGNLTITDSSEDQTGKITTNSYGCIVYPGGKLTLEKGTITSSAGNAVQVHGNGTFIMENGLVGNTDKDYSASAAIGNFGTVTINGGMVKGVSPILNNAPVNGNAAWEEYDGVCTINGGDIIGVPCETNTKNPGRDLGACWGVSLFGPGFDSNGQVDNTALTLNINGGTITAVQGIATNASSGRYAGFTINMKDGTIIGGTADEPDECGMYLPCIGVTNISGGTVKGGQAIRISSGELNITGGEIIGTTLASASDDDLVPGGSGGTQGAVVVGKAGNGYVGNAVVNIGEKAIIRNIATGDGVKPTVVVSDKNMAQDSDQNIKNPNGSNSGLTFNYNDSSISVNINGATIEGDVIKMSNINQAEPSSDGGNTSLILNGAQVNGNVINQTAEGSLDIQNNTNITGSVETQNAASTSVVNSVVAGSVTNAAAGASTTIVGSSVGSIDDTTGTTTMVGSKVDGQDYPDSDMQNVVAIVGGKTFDNLTAALGEAKSGQTVMLYANANLETAIPAGVTLSVLPEKKLTIEQTDFLTVLAGAGTLEIQAGATFEMAGTVFVGDAGTIDLAEGSAAIVFADRTIALQSGAVANIAQGSEFFVRFSETLPIHATVESGATLNLAGKITVPNAENGAPQLTVNGTLNIEEGGLLRVNSKGILDGDGTIKNAGIITLHKSDSNASSATVDATITLAKGGEVYSQLEGDGLDSQIRKAKKTVADGENFTVDGVDVTFPTKYTYYVAPGGGGVTVTPYDIAVSADSTQGTVKTSANSANANDIVTITVTPNDGYVLDAISVTDAKGTAVTVSDNGDGTYTFKMPTSNVTITVTFKAAEPEGMPFTDVQPGDWHYSAVQYVYEKGMMQGTDDTLFSPNVATTRGMLVTILYRLENEPAVSGDNPFSDVAAGSYYENAIMWAAANGIVNGIDDNAFAPDNKLTREQMVTILYRYAQYKGYDVSVANDNLAAFTDKDAISGYAVDALDWSIENGLIEGMGDGTVAPQDGALRGQMAAVLMRLCENIAK